MSAALSRLLRPALATRRWDRFARSNFCQVALFSRDEKLDLIRTASASEARLFPVKLDMDEESASSLCSIIESNADVMEALKLWTKRGNSFTTDVFSSVYSWLLQQRRHNVVVKLLEGVRNEKMVELNENHYVWEIRALCRQRSISKAEQLYDSIPDDKKTDRVKSGLFLSIAKQNALDKAERWLESIQAYTTDLLDVMMILYLIRDKHHKVFATYKRMQALGLEPSTKTYSMLLKCKDRTGGLEGIEKQALEAVEKIDIENSPSWTVNDAMEICGYAGKEDRLSEIWNSVKTKDLSSHFAAITSFGLAGKVAKAREIFKEVIAEGDQHSEFGRNAYAVMLEVYTRKGLMENAERIFKTNKFDSNSFAHYNSMIRGCIATHEVSDGLDKLREGLTAIPRQCVRLDYKTMMVLLPVYAALKDIKNAEKLMRRYRDFGDAGVYSELLKVYRSCKLRPEAFKERMQRNGVEGNNKTDELLKSLSSLPVVSFTRQKRNVEQVA